MFRDRECISTVISAAKTSLTYSPSWQAIPGVALDCPSMRFDESLLRGPPGVNTCALAPEAVTAPGLAASGPRILPGQILPPPHVVFRAWTRYARLRGQASSQSENEVPAIVKKRGNIVCKTMEHGVFVECPDRFVKLGHPFTFEFFIKVSLSTILRGHPARPEVSAGTRCQS